MWKEDGIYGGTEGELEGERKGGRNIGGDDARMGKWGGGGREERICKEDRHIERE